MLDRKALNLEYNDLLHTLNIYKVPRKEHQSLMLYCKDCFGNI